MLLLFSFHICICRFPLLFQVIPEYYILHNDNISRAFLCLPVNDISNIIPKIINKVDSVLVSFRQSKYYDVTINYNTTYTIIHCII
jgi:hypothetical protein